MLQAGQKVSIQYAGELENGNTFVNTWVNGGPVEVTIGAGELLPLFEQTLKGMQHGERKHVFIPVDQAYGPYDEGNVVSVPAENIPDAHLLRAGCVVNMQTSIGSARVKVLGREGDNILLDCNHELAGHDLTFEIELVQDGTETLVQREQGAHGCGCGCDKLKEQLSRNDCACNHEHDHAQHERRACA